MTSDTNAPLSDEFHWQRVYYDPAECLEVYMSRDGMRVMVASPAGVHQADGYGVEALALRYNLPQLLVN